MQAHPFRPHLLIPLLVMGACQGTADQQGNRALPTHQVKEATPSTKDPAFRSFGGMVTVASNAPTREGLPPSSGATPLPTTAEERAQSRLDESLTTRVLPHMHGPPSQLHAVQLLASAPPPSPGLDAILVQTIDGGGQIQSSVFLLDEQGTLVARLPRALADGPHALRIGALRVPLAASNAWQGIANGEIDPIVAGSVLRLGTLVAQDHLRVAAEDGWAAADKTAPAEVLILGIKPDDLCSLEEVPTGRSKEAPTSFRVDSSLPPTLEGWSTSQGIWRGIAQIRIVKSPEQSLILRVGLQGRLP